MANPKARREDETFQEWLARLARERLAEKRPDVTQPPVAPLVDIEPTVAEQVEQTVAEQPATQARMPNLFDQNLPESGGGGFANLLDQSIYFNPTGPLSDPFGDPKFFEASGQFMDMPLQEKFDLVRRGLLQKGALQGEIPESGSEEYQSKPWLKSLTAETLGIPADIVQGIGRAFDSTGIAGAIQEGWTGQPADPGIGSSKQEILGGSDWWGQHFGLTPDKGQEYANWFSDKTTKQKGSFPYWPWKDSEDLPEVEIKLDISKANPAFRPQTTKDKADGKSQVSQRTGTPSVMENSKANIMMQMFGKTDADSKGIEDIMKRAEPDYNMALMIGKLTGKGVGPANTFMNSVLQGAALQYRMNKDQQDKAFQIMTTKPTTYYFHDAKMGVEPINLYPWDNVPKGYTTQRPQLTGQQRNRQQYQEILDEYPQNREAGLDAAIDALIANEGPLFTGYDEKYGYEDPQAARYAKERAASIIVSGWFNPGGGVHYTRQERKEFSEAWKAGKFEEVKRMIRDKNNSWPEEFDELVRAKWGS